jgi:anti-sigma regulatory factor (Ser/Thr protein kinase)
MIVQIDLRQEADPLGRFVAEWTDLVAELRLVVDDDRWNHNLGLCATEAITNAVQHGRAGPDKPPEIRIELEWGDDEWVELRVFDRGPGVSDFASRTTLPDDPLADGGRGIPIMHQIMEEVRYRISEPENCLVLRCRQPQVLTPPTPSTARP